MSYVPFSVSYTECMSGRQEEGKEQRCQMTVLIHPAHLDEGCDSGASRGHFAFYP